METSSPDERYAAAAARADQLLAFVVHVVVYTIVNTGLAVTAGFRPEAGYVWGWGIGLAAHAGVVLLDGRAWRDRIIARELHRKAGR